jgi:hypothetical protein
MEGGIGVEWERVKGRDCRDEVRSRMEWRGGLEWNGRGLKSGIVEMR